MKSNHLCGIILLLSLIIGFSVSSLFNKKTKPLGITVLVVIACIPFIAAIILKCGHYCERKEKKAIERRRENRDVVGELVVNEAQRRNEGDIVDSAIAM